MGSEAKQGLPAQGELSRRVVSALVLAVMALGSTIMGGVSFILVWTSVFALVFYEWWRIVQIGGVSSRFWLGFGALYAALPALSIHFLRLSSQDGLLAVLFLFAVVWGGDIGAYFAGRSLGGPKLAPRISPNKTWSGLIGGVVMATFAGLAVLMSFRLSAGIMHLALAIGLALASAAGDLFESWFKRRFGVKDSGHLIPGHGGFMDRLDGFIVAVVVAAAIGIAHGGVYQSASGLLR